MFIFCIDDTLNIYEIQDTKFIYKSSHLMNVYTFLENIYQCKVLYYTDHKTQIFFNFVI